MKRILLLCVLASLIAATASARPALVQAKYGEAYPDTKVSVSFDTPVTAGSLIVAGVRPSNGGLATITFGGQTLKKDARAPIVTMFSYEVLSLVNAPGGSTTVTATVTGAAGQERMWIAEFSGVATSGTVVLQSTTGSGSGTTLNAGNVTTTNDNELIICAGASDSDEFHTDPVPGSGFTMIKLQDLYDDDKTAVSYRVAATPGTYSCTMFESQSPDWAAIAVSYKPSGGGGSTPTAPAAPANLRISP